MAEKGKARIELGEVTLLDTLFRDGLQGGWMYTSLEKALEVLRWMARLGFHYAECGFPVGNDFARKLIAAAMQEDLGQLRVAAFGRTRKKGERVEDCEDVKVISELNPHTAVIVCKSRLMDVENSLLATPEENLSMIFDTVKHLKGLGFEVIVDLEHAVDAFMGRGGFGRYFGRKDRQIHKKYFQAVIGTAISAGADCITVCDTNGGGAPEEIGRMFRYLVKKYPTATFGFHGHNDGGMAVANTRAAVLSGARHIQGVTNGYGERTGNADIITTTARLQLKDGIQLLENEALRRFTTFANLAAAAFSRSLPRRQPFVGSHAFTTSAGMHASSQLRDGGAYLQCQPDDLGNKEVIKVNHQSGRSNVIAASRFYGLPLTNEQADQLMQAYRTEIVNGAFEINDEAFVLALKYVRREFTPFFEVLVTELSDTDNFITANVKVRIGDTVESRGSNGDGPIDALSRALKKCLRRHYPEIERIHLSSYNLIATSVTEKEGGSPVRVLTGFKSANGRGGPVTWATVGVDTNQNKAGFKAWINGINWFLMENGIFNKNAVSESDQAVCSI